MIKQFIGIDWGSTNLRAWLFDGDNCIDTITSEQGVTRFNGQNPADIFYSVLNKWLINKDMPIIMAGMIGSNAGWIPAPYLMCPQNIFAIAKKLIPIEQLAPLKAWIVPGIAIKEQQHCNVMRGEETQLIGAHTLSQGQYYVMPGTHSKWVKIEKDILIDFDTVMVGELHHLLLKQSLIGVGIGEQQDNFIAYMQGLETGFKENNILRNLFETRAAHLLGQLPKQFVSEWLSGLLIGNEIAQMHKQHPNLSETGVTIIGNQKLSERYQHGLSYANIRHKTINGDDAFKLGIRRIIDGLDNKF